MLFIYGDALEDFIKNQEHSSNSPILLTYLKYHPWISFTLYALLFVFSVISLKKGSYKYQMGGLL